MKSNPYKFSKFAIECFRLVQNLMFAGILAVFALGLICIVPILSLEMFIKTRGLNFKFGIISNSVPVLSINHMFETVIAIMLLLWTIWICQLILLSFKMLKFNVGANTGIKQKNSKLNFRELLSVNSVSFKKSVWAIIIPSIVVFLVLTVASINSISTNAGIGSDRNKVEYSAVTTAYNNKNSMKIDVQMKSSPTQELQVAYSRGYRFHNGSRGNEYAAYIEFLSCGLGGIAIGEIIRRAQRGQLRNRKFGERIWLPTGSLREFECRAVGINYKLYNNLKLAFGIIDSELSLDDILSDICYFEISDDSVTFYLNNIDFTQRDFDSEVLKYDSSCNSILVNLTNSKETINCNFTFKTLPLAFICVQIRNNIYSFINCFCRSPIELFGNFETQCIQNLILECATSILCSGIEEVVVVDSELDLVGFVDLPGFKLTALSMDDFNAEFGNMKIRDENRIVIFNNLNGSDKEFIDQFKTKYETDATYCNVIILNSRLDTDFKITSENIRSSSEVDQSPLNSSLELQFPLRIGEVDLINLRKLIEGLSSDSTTNAMEDEIYSDYREDDNELLNCEVKCLEFEEKVFETLPVSVFGLSEGEILVKVLGQVEVLGTQTAIDKVRLLESIAYIALHPKGVDKTIWATAIWPEQLLTRDSLNTVVWQIRRALGTSKDGIKHMPSSYNGMLRFAPTVYTDYEIFRKLSKSAEESDWVKAMSLVTGRAFEGLNDPNWIALDGYLSDIESRIVDTCVKLVFQKSKSRQYDLVVWALRRALLAVPYDERLWRYLLITYAKSGNLSKLETVMNEIAFTMEDDSEIYTGISDETFRLYRQLCGKEFPRKRLGQKK